MKFGYVGESDAVLIEKYVIEDDKIIIWHLDRSIEVKAYTEENENKIILEMINQAIGRSNVVSSDKIKENNNKFLEDAILQVIISVLTARIWTETSYNIYLRTVALICVFLCCSFVGVNARYYITSKAMYEELKKYETFLSIRDEIKKYKNNSQLYDGIRIKSDDININTIDLYSRKDLLKLKKNLHGIKNRSI